MLYNISHIYCDILYLGDKTRQDKTRQDNTSHIIPAMYLVAEILGQMLCIREYA